MRVLLLFFIFITAYTVAQEKNRKITVSLEDGSKATVEVDNTNKKIKAKSKYTYSWFKSKTILSTQGAYQGGLLNGLYQENYPNKQLKAQGNYVYGLKNGIWRFWNEKGELIKEERWKKGTEAIKKVKVTKEKQKGSIQPKEETLDKKKVKKTKPKATENKNKQPKK